MPNDSCVTFMSNVSNQLYDNLNKTSDLRMKLSQAIRFEGRFEVALVNCIKYSYDILSKDRTYKIKLRPVNFSDEVLVEILTLIITPLLIYLMRYAIICTIQQNRGEVTSLIHLKMTEYSSMRIYVRFLVLKTVLLK